MTVSRKDRKRFKGSWAAIKCKTKRKIELDRVKTKLLTKFFPSLTNIETLVRRKIVDLLPVKIFDFFLFAILEFN